MIFKKENDELLMALAVKNDMDMDKVISAYLITGDMSFLLMRVFEGQTVKFPSKRRLGTANLHNIHFIEDDERLFKDYDKYDEIEYDGKTWTVVSAEKKLLNHWYIPVMEATDGDN